MKNRDFFYLQYNKINWKNQEKTKINFFIYDYIIRNVISRKKGKDISIFDIGFGIGLFFKKLLRDLRKRYNTVTIEGCEPSKRNYKYFLSKKVKGDGRRVVLKIFNKTFLKTRTEAKFDFITSIYVFPHFLLNDLKGTVRKIHSMLKDYGKFILVVANEKYLANKLINEQDLFIERREVSYGRKKYWEVLHYSDIPKIGKVIDYNREETFYLDLFNFQKIK